FGDSGRGSWLQSFVAKLKLLHWVAFLSGIPGVSELVVTVAGGDALCAERPGDYTIYSTIPVKPLWIDLPVERSNRNASTSLASPVATALGMKSVQIDPQAQRVHQLEYFHRYLLVHHSTELLTAAWPLVSNTSAFKRISQRLAGVGKKPLAKSNCGVCRCPAQVGWHQISPCGCRICHYCWYAEEVPSKATCPSCGGPFKLIMSDNPPSTAPPAAPVEEQQSVPVEASANVPPAEGGTAAAQFGSPENPIPAVVVAEGVPLPGQETLPTAQQEAQEQDVTSPIPNHYRIKRVEFLGSERAYLLQSENGPCPLLAVANVLLLRNKLQLHKDMSSISFDDLVGRIANIMFDSNQDRGDVAKGLEDAVTLLPSLNKGLDVNVKFDSCDGFEFTPELRVFDLLDITLVHGWVVSKDDMSAYPILGPLSYNQAIEKVVAFNELQSQALKGEEESPADPGTYEDGLAVSQWLEENKSQMTYDGLSQIMERLRDNELAVLFRNNHFVTVFKPRPGEDGETHLYALATDIGFASSSIVWERLDTLDGDTLYYDGQFHRATGQSPASRQALNGADEDPDYLLALSLQMDDDERARRRPQTYVGPMGMAMVTNRNDGNQQSGGEQQEGGRRKKKFCVIM
ncbi:Ubiquitin carboxyl-terminal hydrolase MINDY-1, partial [Perkinsus olseni]